MSRAGNTDGSPVYDVLLQVWYTRSTTRVGGKREDVRLCRASYHVSIANVLFSYPQAFLSCIRVCRRFSSVLVACRIRRKRLLPCRRSWSVPHPKVSRREVANEWRCPQPESFRTGRDLVTELLIYAANRMTHCKEKNLHSRSAALEKSQSFR